MDREQIRQLIQQENLTEDSPRLAGKLVRDFKVLCALDAQLEGSAGSPVDLQRLEAENRSLEKAIRDRKAEKARGEKETVEHRASRQSTLAANADNMRALEADIDEQKKECARLQAELDRLKSKEPEKERLKRRQNEMQAEANELQKKIDNLGEEYQRNAELLQSLKSFVEQLEQLEAQMEKTMGGIWGGFKNDAFDRMF